MLVLQVYNSYVLQTRAFNQYNIISKLSYESEHRCKMKVSLVEVISLLKIMMSFCKRLLCDENVTSRNIGERYSIQAVLLFRTFLCKLSG